MQVFNCTTVYNTTLLIFLIFLQESEHLLFNNFKAIMDNFTGTCQRYTDVMAHKYYLQDLLFNKSRSINGTVTIQLALLIVKLQVMANSLQAIEVCVCINM